MPSELSLLYFLTLFISAWCFLQIVEMAVGGLPWSPGSVLQRKKDHVSFQHLYINPMGGC